MVDSLKFILAMFAIGCGTATLPTLQQEDVAAREVWLANHGDRLTRFPDSWRVVWEESCTPRPERDGACVDGYVVVSHRRFGDRWDCELHVKWMGTIAMSTFAHEFVHCIQDIAGERDFEHENAEDAETVLRAQDLLQARGM